MFDVLVVPTIEQLAYWYTGAIGYWTKEEIEADIEAVKKSLLLTRSRSRYYTDTITAYGLEVKVDPVKQIRMLRREKVYIERERLRIQQEMLRQDNHINIYAMYGLNEFKL